MKELTTCLTSTAPSTVPHVPLLAFAAVGAEPQPRWLPRVAPGETAELVGNGYTIAVGMSGAVALLGDQSTNGINRTGVPLSGQKNSVESRHLDEEHTGRSQGILDVLPETKLALQAIGARAATQAAMMLPDTAAPVTSRGDEPASARVRGASWGEM